MAVLVPVRESYDGLLFRINPSYEAQLHKSDRAETSEVDWRGERDRTIESALSRSDWQC